MNDVLVAYNEVARAKELPRMSRGSYHPSVAETILEPDTLWARLVDMAPSQGWLMFQSHQLAFESGLPEPQLSWGVLLAAEATTRSGTTISVNQGVSGGWRLACFSHRSDGEMLCDEVQQRAHDPGIRSLRYLRYWHNVPGQGFVQERACFIGFAHR